MTLSWRSVHTNTKRVCSSSNTKSKKSRAERASLDNGGGGGGGTDSSSTQSRFNILTAIRTSTGSDPKLYDAKTGALVFSESGKLSVSTPSADQGDFVVLSGDSGREMKVRNSSGQLIADIFTRRELGLAYVQDRIAAYEDFTGATIYDLQLRLEGDIESPNPAGEILVRTGLGKASASESAAGVVASFYFLLLPASDPFTLFIERYAVCRPDLADLADPTATPEEVNVALANARLSFRLTHRTGMSICGTDGFSARIYPYGSHTVAVSYDSHDKARAVRFSAEKDHVVEQNVFLASLQGRRVSLFAQQSRFLLMGDQQGDVRAWDLGADVISSSPVLYESIFPSSGSTSGAEWARSVAASGSRVAAAGDEETLKVWELDLNTANTAGGTSRGTRASTLVLERTRPVPTNADTGTAESVLRRTVVGVSGDYVTAADFDTESANRLKTFEIGGGEDASLAGTELYDISQSIPDSQTAQFALFAGQDSAAAGDAQKENQTTQNQNNVSSTSPDSPDQHDVRIHRDLLPETRSRGALVNNYKSLANVSRTKKLGKGVKF